MRLLASATKCPSSASLLGSGRRIPSQRNEARDFLSDSSAKYLYALVLVGSSFILMVPSGRSHSEPWNVPDDSVGPVDRICVPGLYPPAGDESFLPVLLLDASATIGPTVKREHRTVVRLTEAAQTCCIYGGMGPGWRLPSNNAEGALPGCPEAYALVRPTITKISSSSGASEVTEDRSKPLGVRRG